MYNLLNLIQQLYKTTFVYVSAFAGQLSQYIIWKYYGIVEWKAPGPLLANYSKATTSLKIRVRFSKRYAEDQL